MAIIRDLGYTVQSLEDRGLITCSTANIPTNTANPLFSTGNSTGNIVYSSSGAAGRIIDRLSSLFTKNRFFVAVPATLFYSSRGSTEANRQLTIGVKLQHGDSSGGGDMADYSTESQPADKVYFTAARTTAYQNWTTDDIDGGSTGPIRLMSDQSYYDLRAAKRFIRAVHTVTKNKATTESSGDENGRISGTITFLGGEETALRWDSKSFVSTATSTTT